MSEENLLKLAARLGLDSTINQSIPFLVKAEKLIAVNRDAGFAQIYKLFLAHSIHRILATDQRGKLQGPISRSNVIRIPVEREASPRSIADSGKKDA